MVRTAASNVIELAIGIVEGQALGQVIGSVSVPLTARPSACRCLQQLHGPEKAGAVLPFFMTTPHTSRPERGRDPS